MNKQEHVTIEISHRTIMFVGVFAALAWGLMKISGILIAIFISFIVMTALNPLVSMFEKKRIPRPLSSMILLITIMTLLVSGVAALVPPIVEQTSALFTQLPSLISQLGLEELDPSFIRSNLSLVPGNAFRFITGAFSNLLGVFTILVISFYLLQERGELARILTHLFGDGEKEVEELLKRVEMKLGGWVRGQIILSFAIGLVTYIGIMFLGLPYAVPLAIIAGILEIVPNIGPTIAAVPAAIVGFTISPLHGAGVIALYIVIQQLENAFLVPTVMKRTVGLSPLTTIVVLMIGLKLGGAITAILAIPLYLTSQVLFDHFSKRAEKVSSES